MSHEGIRLVSPEESRRAVLAEQSLPPAAVTPAKVRVALTEGTGVEIVWKDGHRSQWSFPYLRDACPCATCHEEREQTGRKVGEPKPAPKLAFPMYTPPARPLEALPIGRYALKFKWADGHESGIYSWDFLRRLDEGLLTTDL
ncbi:MAG: DUF971 domain-containing protein [Janthinobacterium lividum]